MFKTGQLTGRHRDMGKANERKDTTLIPLTTTLKVKNEKASEVSLFFLFDTTFPPRPSVFFSPLSVSFTLFSLRRLPDQVADSV